MKPTTTVADFIRRAREARHDAFGIAHDLEGAIALAAVHRDAFVSERAEVSLRRWRELVAEVASASAVEPDPGTTRWLATEHVRLGRAFKLVALEDASLHVDAARWAGILRPEERNGVLGRFELDLLAPFTEEEEGSQD
jgi:hypothetical protein